MSIKLEQEGCQHCGFEIRWEEAGVFRVLTRILMWVQGLLDQSDRAHIADIPVQEVDFGDDSWTGANADP